MPKFKNKRTGKVTEEHLLYYVNKLRNNSNYEEIKEEEKTKTKKNEVGK